MFILSKTISTVKINCRNGTTIVLIAIESLAISASSLCSLWLMIASFVMSVMIYSILIIGVAFSHHATAIELPIVNPGFEASTTEPAGWTSSQHVGEAAYEMVIDSKQPAEGKHSFRITRLGHQVYGMISQRLLLPKHAAGGTLSLSGMLRTKAVGPSGGLLVVNLLDRGGRMLAQVRAAPLSGDNSWRRVSLTAPIPANAHAVEPAFILLDEGTAWVDDIRLGTTLVKDQ